MVNLWDTLPDELQEIILRKSVELCREEYLAAGQARHDRAKKKRGRGLLSADMIRYFMDSTDSMEIINWSFPIELRELEQIIDPPVELLDDIDDYDYAPYHDAFLRRCVAYLEDPARANEWIVPSEDHFLTMFTRLVEFKNKHGHLDTAAEAAPDLHAWLEWTRDSDTVLTRERRYSLRSLGVRLPRQRVLS